MRTTHTIPEQLRELAGARQLAYAVLTRADATPEAKARARRLLVDIGSARMALHRDLFLEQSAAWRERVMSR